MIRKYTIFILFAGIIAGMAGAALGYTIFKYTRPDRQVVQPEQTPQPHTGTESQTGASADYDPTKQPSVDRYAKDYPSADTSTVQPHDVPTRSINQTGTSDEKAVLENTDVDSIPQYVLSLLNGYVAVFYASEDYKTQVKEVTATPVNALSKDERQRLATGIKIFDDEQLARILQDYGS